MLFALKAAGALSLVLAVPSLARTAAPVSLRDSSPDPWRIVSGVHRSAYQVTVTHADPKLGKPYTRTYPGLSQSDWESVNNIHSAPEKQHRIWRANAVDITLLPGDTAMFELTSKGLDRLLYFHLVDSDDKECVDPGKTMPDKSLGRAFLSYTVKQIPGGLAVGEWSCDKSMAAGVAVASGGTQAEIKVRSWGKDGIPVRLP